MRPQWRRREEQPQSVEVEVGEWANGIVTSGQRVSREKLGFFASAPPLLGGLIWREILCFVLWLLDCIWVLGFLLLLLLGWQFWERERERERETERCCWCCYIWDLGVIFLSEFKRRWCAWNIYNKVLTYPIKKKKSTHISTYLALLLCYFATNYIISLCCR